MVYLLFFTDVLSKDPKGKEEKKANKITSGGDNIGG